MVAAKKMVAAAEVAPLDEAERVARIRAGYGRDCAICDQRMLGGQRLDLDEQHRPIHMRCAADAPGAA